MVLSHLRIPHGKLSFNIVQKLEKIFKEIFKEKKIAAF
jgi:hypothetical protein